MPVSYTATNQIVQTGSNLITYDAAGNIQPDATYYYQYDGNERLCALGTRATQGQTGWIYVYDADGSRVAKETYALNSQPTTVNGQPILSCMPTSATATVAMVSAYIVDEDGEAVTEMTVVAGQVSWGHTNVFVGGKVLTTYDPMGLHFQVADWLGSRRVQTNAFGQAEEICSNQPYGDGQNCYTPDSAPATADDATEHHFTGMERDAETGGGIRRMGWTSSVPGTTTPVLEGS